MRTLNTHTRPRSQAHTWTSASRHTPHTSPSRGGSCVVGSARTCSSGTLRLALHALYNHPFTSPSVRVLLHRRKVVSMLVLSKERPTALRRWRRLAWRTSNWPCGDTQHTFSCHTFRVRAAGRRGSLATLPYLQVVEPASRQRRRFSFAVKSVSPLLPPRHGLAKGTVWAWILIRVPCQM